MNFWASIAYLEGITAPTCGRNHAASSMKFCPHPAFSAFPAATRDHMSDRGQWNVRGVVRCHSEAWLQKHPCGPPCTLSLLPKQTNKQPNSSTVEAHRKGLKGGPLRRPPSQEHRLQTLHESRKQSGCNSGAAYCNNWPILISTPPPKFAKTPKWD